MNTAQVTQTLPVVQAAFPNARVYRASELAPTWVGVAIDLGQTTYVVYEQDEAADGGYWWTLDAIDHESFDTSTECHRTLAACLGAILATHIATTFGV